MKRQVVAPLRIRGAAIAMAGVFTRAALAQSPVQAAAPNTPVGTWRGTSVCLMRSSACNDETVIYRITPINSADSLAIDARKIVRGAEQEMGVLGCVLVPRASQLTCTIPHGVWHFSVRNDSLRGELRLVDNTRFREVRTIRAP